MASKRINVTDGAGKPLAAHTEPTIEEMERSTRCLLHSEATAGGLEPPKLLPGDDLYYSAGFKGKAVVLPKLLFMHFTCKGIDGCGSSEHEHGYYEASWADITMNGMLSWQLEGEMRRETSVKMKAVWLNDKMAEVERTGEFRLAGKMLPFHSSGHGRYYMDARIHSGIVGLTVESMAPEHEELPFLYSMGVELTTRNGEGTPKLQDVWAPTPNSSPFRNHKAVQMLCSYLAAWHKETEPVKKAIGFFKEFHKPKPIRVFAAEIKADRTKKHWEWTKEQVKRARQHRDTYVRYSGTLTLAAQKDIHHGFRRGDPELTGDEPEPLPFMHDPDYTYDEWQREAYDEAEREESDARQEMFKAERHLEHVKTMHESQVDCAARENKRKRDDNERWSKKRQNRERRLEGKFCQFSNGETNHRGEKRKHVDEYKVIAGVHENKVGKHTGRDCDDGCKILVKISDGYDQGKVITVDQDDLDWFDDVEEDEAAADAAFDARCAAVLAHVLTLGNVEEDDAASKPWVYAYNNLKDKFRTYEWQWYFTNADAAWADTPSKEQIITIVKQFCRDRYWDFEFTGY